MSAHLGDLCGDVPAASPAFRGGQTAADAVLATLDLTGYAARRNTVLGGGGLDASAGPDQISG